MAIGTLTPFRGFGGLRVPPAAAGNGSDDPIQVQKLYFSQNQVTSFENIQIPPLEQILALLSKAFLAACDKNADF